MRTGQPRLVWSPRFWEILSAKWQAHEKYRRTWAATEAQPHDSLGTTIILKYLSWLLKVVLSRSPEDTADGCICASLWPSVAAVLVVLGCSSGHRLIDVAFITSQKMV